MPSLPALFVSHGAPTMALEDGATPAFLRGLGRSLPRPRAVLCVSAHWEAPAPVLGAAPRPETIHDFYGFPAPLYALRYPAPGASDLAADAARLLGEAGIEAALDRARGLDHGAWVPLLLMYPDADVPVTQLSVQTGLGPAHQHALGRALAPLREAGVLVLASGGATHNLGDFGRYAPDAAPVAYAKGFADWLARAVESGDEAALLDYRARAPEAARNHPTEEHLLPLFAALGAGGGVPGRVLHRDFRYGVLSLAAYAWD